MSDTISAKILNALLDKYERSSFFRDKKQPTRRIMLDFYNGGKSDFSYYDIEQSERRIAVNRAVIDLSKKLLLDFDWMKGEREHIIAKVWLNTENLPLAYQTAGRMPKSDMIEQTLKEIKSVQDEVKSSWACAYLRDAYEAISSKRKLINTVPSNKRERNLLFQAIAAIDKLDGAEYMERVFSLRTFGDSKEYERFVKSRLLSILRRYLDLDDDTSDEDILKQIGIVKYPEQFEFCGNVSITFDSGSVDFRHLSGGTIFSTDLSHGIIRIDPLIESIVTIENRANYIEYIYEMKTEKELVVYHGGQYSPRKRIFLRALAKAAPLNCKWYHWSDIDYGGFIMLLRLRQEIKPDIIPYRMNSGELVRYTDLLATTNAIYTKKLKRLKDRPELSDCYECIDYMIENMVRLEQEAMLGDS